MCANPNSRCAISHIVHTSFCARGLIIDLFSTFDETLLKNILNFATMIEKTGKILIVDDNEDVLLSLNMLLKPWVEAIRVTTNPDKIVDFLAKFQPDVILLDMNFSRDAESGEEGYYWLQRILRLDADAVVMFITAYESTEKTVRAIRAGAIDFIPKPWDKERLVDAVKSAVALRRERLHQAAEQLVVKSEATIKACDVPVKPAKESSFIGASPAIAQLKDYISRVAPTNANVLITGENGTGKDVVAHELHRLSRRADSPLVSIDLGCIPESLFESELFGHEKGAFTGAVSAKEGRIEAADGGTLFLDEIGNLSLAMQQKLLTVIEKRQTSRVGSTKLRNIDVRILAATNADLQARVAEGTFRQDLLYRLNTIELKLPPLRERGKDILLLANHFRNIAEAKYQCEMKALTAAEQTKMLTYAWPGNVRELQHAMERCVVMQTEFECPEETVVAETVGEMPTLNLEELEHQAVMKALDMANGNLSQAAVMLGITRYALYRKIGKIKSVL